MDSPTAQAMAVAIGSCQQVSHSLCQSLSWQHCLGQNCTMLRLSIMP